MITQALTLDRTSWHVGNERSYDVWGGVRSGAATGGPKGRYCANLGHVQDDESGLIYMRARYYEPSTGRFISEDPAMDGGNWYVYCNNVPSTHGDPTGKVGLLISAIALIWFIEVSKLVTSSLEIETCWGIFMSIITFEILNVDGLDALQASTSHIMLRHAIVKSLQEMDVVKGGLSYSKCQFGRLGIVLEISLIYIGHAHRLKWYIDDVDNF